MDTTVEIFDGPVPLTENRPPFLHDAVVTLCAPSFVLSRAGGQLDGGADGFYHGDSRALSRLSAVVEGAELAPLGAEVMGADRAEFRAALRGLGEVTTDTAVALRRRRTVSSGRLEETFEISNAGTRHVRFRFSVDAGTDLASMERVRTGHGEDEMPAEAAAGGTAWSRNGFAVRLVSEPAAETVDAAAGRFSYQVRLAPGQSWSVLLVCTAAHDDGDQFPAAPADQKPWRTPVLRSADRRFDCWLAQSVADLDRLRLTDPRSDDRGRADQFLAAGVPWYLTLFGRDAIWAARMLLPLGTELAAGTLRTLARRQGEVVDSTAEEQPGKILHEVRRGAREYTSTLALPAVYYGTVDATPLWITLLHDAWRWGMAADQVEQLLPHANSALAWMRDHGDTGDGFLRYVDRTGRGLANQGWKDSVDAIRHRDGRLADPPIALCEVQAYAYEAARGGAALLRAFGRPGADEWEEWADRLRTSFRARFWVEDSSGAYPAVALDRDGRPVDSVTSGFGHLLGTGLLDQEESALLAARLSAPDLDSGHGLRTLSSDTAGFNPYGYHIGSIWPHDTAIAVHGLVRAGFPDAAAGLAAGLLDTSEAFDARLPELFAGHGTTAGRRPPPYPTSCRPQAWAATASILVLQAALGLEADVPGGKVTLAPTFAREYGPLTVSGLQVAGEELTVTIGADGVTSAVAPDGITVIGAASPRTSRLDQHE
ncbi:glycogen debranching N-terminal domain-containing protein [Amycolatopsis alkalitolerans]|uniref:Amylo-alpha-1,6-glucosidase n=1 Tax=Amycolatopsis alkalitolerans TaxID=2547244 RepID=A0A5C4M4N4_9PSEU|nr:glycogen debranching N-terminal domain-containing protein [Amycolatopsis alkalitolerans]TNC28058.1 amylo-alpha-1,6-glucosidase [Amycolatopsis alkalitolerans]